MYTNPENQRVVKKSGKKIAVALSESLDHQICMELLSVIYEDLDMEPISVEQRREEEEGLITSQDPMETMILDTNTEIICPILPVFDSTIFVFNYQKFYKK